MCFTHDVCSFYSGMHEKFLSGVHDRCPAARSQLQKFTSWQKRHFNGFLAAISVLCMTCQPSGFKLVFVQGMLGELD